jgi:hypothetical protein
MSKLLTEPQLEEIYMDGCPDDVSGDVDAPTGHFYRIGRQILVTDSQGFRTVHNYTDEAEAVQAFEVMNNEFGEWDDDE